MIVSVDDIVEEVWGGWIDVVWGEDERVVKVGEGI